MSSGLVTPPFTFYTELYEVVSLNLIRFWQGTAGSRGLGVVMSDMVLETARILLIIYVILWGVAYIRGSLNETIAEAAWRLGKLMVIYAFAASFARFQLFFGDTLWSFPTLLADTINGRAGFVESGAPPPGSVSMMESLDNLMTRYVYAGRLFNDKAYLSAGTSGMPDLTLWLAAVVIWGLGLAFTSYAVFLFLFCRLALAILLGFAAVFILSLVFPSTRRFFSMWVNQMVKYILIFTLAAGLMALYTSAAINYMDDTQVINAFANPNINLALPPAVLAIIGLLIFMQIPKLSGYLSDGVRLVAMSSFEAIQTKVQSFRT